MLRKTLSIFVAIFAITYVTAQEIKTADDILNSYFENTGGIQAWKSLKSTKMVGKMSMQRMEFPGTIYAAPPNKQRVEVDVQGMKIIQAYDGETAWWINPMQGGTEPQKMPEMMAQEMTKEKFESEFINYAEKGHKVELLDGMEEIDGVDCYVIKLTKKSEEEEYFFFDSENFVPIMVKAVVETGPQAGAEIETYMSDYQEIDGLIMPYYIETKMGGQTLQKITMDTVQLNFTVENSLFDYPKKDEKIAAPMEDKKNLEKPKAKEEEKQDLKLPTKEKKKKINNGNR